MQRYEAKSLVMKALAHPTRLFIVDELARGERCVCELRDMIDADISTVSRHLALLKTARIVTDDKRGQQVFYRLRTPCVLGFFDCVEDPAVIRRILEHFRKKESADSQP